MRNDKKTNSECNTQSISEDSSNSNENTDIEKVLISVDQLLSNIIVRLLILRLQSTQSRNV